MMIFAGIVIFNPNYERFKQNIECIINQVEEIILYNNGCSEEVKLYIDSLASKKVKMVGEGCNLGLAYALNQIMKVAKDDHANWMITLDQDSVLPENYVNEIEKRISLHANEKIAIICPSVIDKRRINISNKVVSFSNDDYYINMCITSGSCTNIKAWEDVGKFDEYLFIDLIDNDFCKRLVASDWKILKIASVELDQEFGKITPKGERTVSFLKKVCEVIPNEKLAVNVSKLAYKKTVDPMRVYYTNRNIIYLNRKLKKIGGIGYESYNANSYLGYVMFFNLPSLLRAGKKYDVARAIIKGTIDGIRAKRNAIIFEINQ